MDHFMNTNLPGIVWASFLAIALGLFLIKGRRGAEEDRPSMIVQLFRGLMGALRLLIALALIVLGVGSFFFGRKLQDFMVLDGREVVLQASVMWMRADSVGGKTMLNVSRHDDPLSSGNQMFVTLPSKDWAVRVHVIRWPNWAETFGFRPIYRITELHSWNEIETGEPDWAHPFPYSKQAIWDDILKYGAYFTGFSIEEMDSRKISSSEESHYQIAISPQGIEIVEDVIRRTRFITLPEDSS